MLKFNVSGMSCGHCVSAVTKAIQSAYPQAKVLVDLSAQRVTVEQVEDAAQVQSLIEEAGYTVHQ